MDDSYRKKVNGEAAFAVDDQNRVVFWGDGATRLLGFKSAQALRQPLDHVLSAKDDYGNRLFMANDALHEMARRGEEIHGFVAEIDRFDGSPLRVFSTVEVVRPQQSGSHQLLFRLLPDRRRPMTLPALRHVLQQAVGGRGRTATRSSSSNGAVGAQPELSERQKQVLSLLSEGLHCEQIANELNLSVCTVRRHLQNAMERLDAHTQAELVATSIRQGLI